MNYLTKDELTRHLHTYVVTRYGGGMGIASQDRLTSALDPPRQVMFDIELYPDLPSKAAALTFLMIKSRPFVGANEATALMALLRFLALNDTALNDDVSDTDLLWLARAVNHSDLNKDGVERWMRENIRFNHKGHEGHEEHEG